MGLLMDGVWHDQWYDTVESKGVFVRDKSRFRHWITATGEAGASGEGGFLAEAGRYHLYVSLACPWAHRTLIFRALKGLESIISVSVVDPDMLESGWRFSGGGVYPGATRDHVNSFDYLHQLYTFCSPNYTGRVTVPVLWDKQRGCIVSNESSEIIRMFNSAFNHITGNLDDYYPESLQGDIDALNQRIYDAINNGVYRAGFATTQSAYEEAYDTLFSMLDELEGRLATRRYLMGEQLTEADWRLFTTLIRFDAVYYGHFKTNKRRLEDYPALSAYVRDLFQTERVAATVNFDHIKRHYYFSHRTINPTGMVPKGPDIDYMRPHYRASL